MNPHETYISPLSERYASSEMLFLFSAQKKYSLWRKLWRILAEEQKRLGLPITDEQISEMKACEEKIDFQRVAFFEKKFLHETMAHIHAFGEQAPLARPIMHLGATSAFVMDNTQLIQIKEAFLLLEARLVSLLSLMANRAENTASIPTLGYTHLQPAQPTTLGKRMTLWMYSLFLDLRELRTFLTELPFRSIKGATGTQASLKPFFSDFKDVQLLEERLSARFGFSHVLPVSSQVYDRKWDVKALHILSGIAQSAHKITNDIRFLQSKKELSEGFERDQIGSSAMAYKQNPIKSERVASLSKYVISLVQSTSFVSATQFLERTLDDSAHGRIVLSSGFLSVDAIVILLEDIMKKMVFHEKIIQKNLASEYLSLVSENLLMITVQRGFDRQEMHEKIRSFLLSIPLGDPSPPLSTLLKELSLSLHPHEEQLLSWDYLIGFAPEQVAVFLEEVRSFLL